MTFWAGLVLDVTTLTGSLKGFSMMTCAPVAATAALSTLGAFGTDTERKIKIRPFVTFWIFG